VVLFFALPAKNRMLIHKLTLSNFRNFGRKSFDFSPNTTVIIGPNASGKSNILEALYLLSAGKSFRARVEEEMIGYRHEISRINGQVAGSMQDVASKEKSHSTNYMLHATKLEVVLTRGEITIGEDPEKKQKAPRKKLLVNGVSRRLFNFAGNLKTVLFGPWDLDLVTESPSLRRRFLDGVLSQIDREYRRASLSYEKGLRQRNKLLYQIREGSPISRSRSLLMFWDRLLIKNGNYITQKREELITFIDQTKDFNSEDFSIEYDESTISEARLEHYREEEIAAATTLVGPHRDDFCMRLKKNKRPRELARFGSRGEQRMGVLWLKLAELAFIEKETQEKPVLLLDDIFSELDHEHRNIVMKIVKGQQTRRRQGFGGQAIITTADEHFIKDIDQSGIVRIDI
jgi:DNA replication and repair protein RecF